MSLHISRPQWLALLAALEEARRERHVLTYRSLIERLQLRVPAMATLAAALEHLAALDCEAGRPLRSALVVSQGADRLPRPGFFECAQRLGRFDPLADPHGAAWHHAELARVFSWDYSATP